MKVPYHIVLPKKAKPQNNENGSSFHVTWALRLRLFVSCPERHRPLRYVTSLFKLNSFEYVVQQIDMPFDCWSGRWLALISSTVLMVLCVVVRGVVPCPIQVLTATRISNKQEQEQQLELGGGGGRIVGRWLSLLL